MKVVEQEFKYFNCPSCVHCFCDNDNECKTCFNENRWEEIPESVISLSAKRWKVDIEENEKEFEDERVSIPA